jgi:hypothetical protein
MTQEIALQLLRSGQMSPARYLKLCNEEGWDPKWALLPGAKDKNASGLEQAKRNSDVC